MGLYLKALHEVEAELRATRRKLSPLYYRKQRAGAFKTRNRIQTRIDAVMDEITAIEERLIHSWESK
jgi:hypothetical protein